MVLGRKNLGIVLFAVFLCARPASAVLVFDPIQPIFTDGQSPAKWGSSTVSEAAGQPLERSCPWRGESLPFESWLDGADGVDWAGSGSANVTLGPLVCPGPVVFAGIVWEPPSCRLQIFETTWIPGFSINRIFRPPRLRCDFRSWG